MSGEEIKAKIAENNKIIEENKSFFVLNLRVRKAMDSNKKLRAICKHNFEEGKCIYCDQLEAENGHNILFDKLPKMQGSKDQAESKED